MTATIKPEVLELDVSFETIPNDPGFSLYAPDDDHAYEILKRINAYPALEARVKVLEQGLKEIEKGEGPYSRDPLKHAGNCIEAMRFIARSLLKGAKS